VKDVLNKSNSIDVRRDRFIRIAEYRVNRILDCLDSLGKCSNKRNYEYSVEDIKRIFREIEEKVSHTKLLFHDTNRNKKRFALRA